MIEKKKQAEVIDSVVVLPLTLTQQEARDASAAKEAAEKAAAEQAAAEQAAAEAAEIKAKEEAQSAEETAPSSTDDSNSIPEEGSLEIDEDQLRTALEGPCAEAVARILVLQKTHPDNRMAKHFDLSYFNSLDAEDQKALIQCCRSGTENADSGMGCYAMQPADYDRFKPFFSKVLADYHGVAADAKHESNWSLEGVTGLPEDGKLDLTTLGLETASMRVRVGRNLADYPLPGAMTKEDRVALEKKMCEAFEKLKAMPEYGGRYNSLTDDHPDHISEDEYKQLVADHIMFKDMAADSYLSTAGIASHWPYGRGCYVSEDRGFIIWVGEEDHLRIMCMKKGNMLNDVFDRLHTALNVVESIEGLSFAKSPDYGNVTSCPTNLGTGMRASLHIPLPNLTKDGTDRKAKEVCKPLGLSVRGTGGEHTPIGADGTCDISPRARFCITEAEIITALYNGIKLLREAETAASDEN